MQHTTGNRCGYKSGCYRTPEPQPSIKLPLFLTQTATQILQCGIPGLRARGEREEARRAVIAVLIEQMDIYTQRIGVPTESGWLPFGWQSVLKRLPWLSENRLWEVLADLRREGIFESNQRLKHPSFKTHDASKSSGWAVSDKGFTDRFWLMIRAQARLRHEKEHAQRRHTERAISRGKQLADFYARAWAHSKSRAGCVIAAAGIVKAEKAAAQQAAGQHGQPSVRQIEIMIIPQLIALNVADVDATARRLAIEYGYQAVDDPGRYL